MIKFNVLTRLCWTFLVALTLTLGLAACEGDDGSDGAAGAAGADGSDGSDGQACWDLNANGLGDLPDEDINGDGEVDVNDCSGTSASVTPLESCGVCHNDGSFASAKVFHEVFDYGSFANFVVAPDVAVPADLIVSFSVTVNGAAATGATFYRAYASDGTVRTSLTDEIEADLGNLFVNNGDGTYSARIVDGVARFDGNHRYLVILRNALTNPAATPDLRDLEIAAVGDYPAPIPLAGLASSAACQGCHGDSGEGTFFEGRLNPLVAGGHYSAPMGADACVVCHRPDDPATPDEDEEPSYQQLVKVVHGIHNSHNFPPGDETPDGGYTTGRDQDRSTDGVQLKIYDVSYPTYMTNCSVCHSDDTILPATGGSALAAANAMPVSGEGCFTCHGSMDSWDFIGPNGEDYTFHLTSIADPLTADCGVCHNDVIAPGTVTGFHNGLTTGRGGIIWDGVDTSVTEGAKFVWEITGVVDDGTNLAISWQASYDGVGVDPCNATPAAGEPAFHAIPPFTRPDGTTQNRNNLSMLRNYAQGDDFILGQSETAPGQALNVSLTTDNTTCASNVATTTIPVDPLEDVDAERGRVALQGKPWVVAVDPDDADGVMQVRVKTPTYEWTVGDGAPPVASRRNVVDTTGKCLNCHVGSLYQHGGNRVDNVDMCILCHNSASNEKNVRVGMGVDETESYDGKSGETFEMKTMLHRIHSAGVDDQPVYAIYRNRGIYAFAPDVSDVPNWAVGDACVDRFGRPANIVFGADPAIENSCQVHNFHSADYPRALNACTACHTADITEMPDQTQAMATTTEAGSTTEWDDQLDDTLQGATTTACVTCHADGASKGHAYQNSWTPQVFPEGRQTIIDAVN